MSLLSKKIGIDLGSSTVKVYVKGEGVVVNEPSVVALNHHPARILAVGKQALEMAGRSPGEVRVVRPMRDGAIADLAVTESMLHHLIGKLQGRQRMFKPEVMVCVASGVTSAERCALTEAAISAGARQAWLIDEPLAAALGAGLQIAEPRAHAVCDIGAGTSKVAVISRSGMVVADSIRVGGDRVDRAITEHVQRRHGLLLDQARAEGVKLAVASAVAMDHPLAAEVDGMGKTVEVTSNEFVEAIEETLRSIVEMIRKMLVETPRELAPDVFDRGIVLTGGGAQLRGLAGYVSSQTGLPAVVTPEPQTSVVRGTGMALENFEVLKRNQSYLR